MSDTKLNMLSDVEMTISVELGRTKMLFKDILKMESGEIIELNTSTGDRLDFLVNSHLVAKGEVMVIDGRFALRVTDVVGSLTKAVESGLTGQGRSR